MQLFCAIVPRDLEGYTTRTRDNDIFKGFIEIIFRSVGALSRRGGLLNIYICFDKF